MKIKSIKEIQPRTVYAIHTSTNTFISNGLAHHNCYVCNVRNHGEQLEYYYFMRKHYSEEAIIEMRKMRYETVKYTIEDYDKIADKYKQKTADLLLALQRYGAYHNKTRRLLTPPRLCGSSAIEQ